MNRQVLLAKSILEDRGYNVTYKDDDYDAWQRGKRGFNPENYGDEEPPFDTAEQPIRPPANQSSTTAEKVDYVKQMIEIARRDRDPKDAWEIVNFLHDSMLLDELS